MKLLQPPPGAFKTAFVECAFNLEYVTHNNRRWYYASLICHKADHRLELSYTLTRRWGPVNPTTLEKSQGSCRINNSPSFMNMLQLYNKTLDKRLSGRNIVSQGAPAHWAGHALEVATGLALFDADLPTTHIQLCTKPRDLEHFEWNLL